MIAKSSLNAASNFPSEYYQILWLHSKLCQWSAEIVSAASGLELSNGYLPINPVKSNRDKSAYLYPFCSTESRKFFKVAEVSDEYLLWVTESLENLSV